MRENTNPNIPIHLIAPPNSKPRTKMTTKKSHTVNTKAQTKNKCKVNATGPLTPTIPTHFQNMILYLKPTKTWVPFKFPEQPNCPNSDFSKVGPSPGPFTLNFVPFCTNQFAIAIPKDHPDQSDSSHAQMESEGLEEPIIVIDDGSSPGGDEHILG